MKVVILAGGKGSRISYYTEKIPKPMIKIGNIPMLTHIMRIFKYYGFDDFLIATGYRGEMIKRYYRNSKEFHKIKIVDTGKYSNTGGRLLKLKKILKNENFFFMTYGDGVANLNLIKLINFHNKHKKIATVTAVRPPARFGELKLRGNKILKFEEKPQVSENWINGGFFVFNSKIFDFIKDDKTMLEREPLEKLAKIGELVAFKHSGFWQCMDTIRDKNLLNKLWTEKKAPWRK